MAQNAQPQHIPVPWNDGLQARSFQVHGFLLRVDAVAVSDERGFLINLEVMINSTNNVHLDVSVQLAQDLIKPFNYL